MRVLIAAALSIVFAPATAQVYLGHGTIAVENLPAATTPDGFGWVVLRHDDQLIVGAADHDRDGRGAVVFHRREAGTWVEFQRLTPPGDAATGHFGYALAMAGDRLVVGAPTTPGPDGSESAGAVHVYAFDAAAGAWARTHSITEPTPGALAHFGRALTFADDTLFVGAPYVGPTSLALWEPSEAGALGGRVYAYRHDPAVDAWALVQTLRGGDSFARFGASLVADAGRLVVGATGERALYVYQLGADDATRIQRFPSPEAGDSFEVEFGRSLSLIGDRLLVSARGPFYYTGVPDRGPAGVAYVLDFVDGAFEHTGTLHGVDSQFGWTALLLDEKQALVSAPSNGGAVLHFVEESTGWTTAQLIAEPVQSAAETGTFGEVLAFTGGELYVGLYEIPLVAPPFAVLALTEQAPEFVPTGETATFEFTVASGGAVGVAVAYLDVRTGMDVLTAPAGCFDRDVGVVRCELGAIEAGGSHTASFEMRMPSDESSLPSLFAYAGSERPEAITRDNLLHHQVLRSARPPAMPLPPPDDEGGGVLGWLTALFLLAMLKSRIRLRGSAPCSARTCGLPASTPNSR